jgi:hypothetical protein|tara:strand:+ start:663 stop:908 length:246 start_codon:yes stop_codon:yes gene_type:complete
MNKINELIDTLIEISCEESITPESRIKLDDVIDELLNFQLDTHGMDKIVPNLNELSPEELEELKLFELLVHATMNNTLAMA